MARRRVGHLKPLSHARLIPYRAAPTAPARPSWAAHFAAASNQYLYVYSAGAGLHDLSAGFTLAAWVKLAGPTAAARPVAGLWGPTALAWLFDARGANVPTVFASPDGAAVVAAAAGSALTPGVWSFVVAWLDTAAHTLNARAGAGPVGTAAYAAAGVNVTVDPLAIGANFTGGTMDGSVGPLGFWHRALGPAERDWLAARPRAAADLAGGPAGLAAGLFAYYDYSDPGGLTADGSGGGHALTNNAGTTRVAGP